MILTTPQGETFSEQLTLELLADLQAKGELILVCGRYKGIDERARELVVTREVSIGDYVLSGGELPALVVVDAIVRRLPGVLHDEDSAANDSFTADRDGGLDCAWYTKPPVYRGLDGARGADVGSPREHRGVAPAAGRRAHAGTTAGSGHRPRRSAEEAEEARLTSRETATGGRDEHRGQDAGREPAHRPARLRDR